MLTALIVGAWLIPLALATMAVVGYLRGRKLRTAYAREMIIQITTIGNQESVNAIVAAIRGYDLRFPYRIWIVTEPRSSSGYEGADRVIVVPADFKCRASYKCRALEYVRRLRAREGLTDRHLKILFLDDDSLPSQGYIEKSFHADHDICQGIIIPRTSYGRLLSHMDNLRTLNCVVFCSVFQGFGHPIQVHGEGLCVRASTEQVVTWDHPVVASEDLVFGQMAAHKGVDWGFFYDFVYITSPWTFRDYLKQRRRWLWGNIHAIRFVLPRAAKGRLIIKWVLGFGGYIVATAGVLLDRLGYLEIPADLRPVLAVSLIAFLGSFAVSGWVNGAGRVSQTVASVVLAFLTCGFSVFVLLAGLIRGDPRRFEVIQKLAGGPQAAAGSRRSIRRPSTRFGAIAATTFGVGLFVAMIFTAYLDRIGLDVSAGQPSAVVIQRVFPETPGK